MKYLIRLSALLVIALTIFPGCKDDKIVNPPADCPDDLSLEGISSRNFTMGFSTWSFGPDESDNQATYQFITEHADIYSEQIDNRIPWSSWINNTDLPSEFVNDIQYRVSNRIPGHKLLLSVSLLNTDRSDLLEDYDGTTPTYTSLNDPVIEDAYFDHLEYLITQLQPDYLVMAMEVNEFRLKSASKWEEYKLLMANLRSRLKESHPGLPLAESITLHNWYAPDVNNPEAYIEEISSYINQHMDFAAISYYPFFKGFHSKNEFRLAFDFLHENTTLPVAFVETNHLAEDLVISNLNTNIASDVCEQKDYLEVLLKDASEYNYEFVIWWAYRDYDELWETFPDEVKDIGKIWRDTGLLDENGNERPAYHIWEMMLDKNYTAD